MLDYLSVALICGTDLSMLSLRKVFFQVDSYEDQTSNVVSPLYHTHCSVNIVIHSKVLHHYLHELFYGAKMLLNSITLSYRA